MSEIERVAIVTGGGRGIGAACAKLLGAHGVRVVVNFVRDTERAAATVAAIEGAGGRAVAVQADVHKTEDANRLVATALDAFGRVDILVSNAPGGWAEKSFEQSEWAELRAIVDDELKAAFDLTKAVLPAMKAQEYGRLVYMASGLAQYPMDGALASGASKGALITFMRYVAFELGKYGITANAVSPGFVETELSQGMPAEAKRQMAMRTPVRRLCMPEDVAGVVAFLASEESGYVTGTNQGVNGGTRMD